MKTITSEDLNRILEDHSKWLKSSGNDGVQADLAMTDLSGANLVGADLSGANLVEADLHEADLRGADLRWAYLRWANLIGANLYRANLHDTNLRGADLSGANLCWANLRDATLNVANLSKADLYGADLVGADLVGANLVGANISVPIACPEEGSFIGFKKASDKNNEIEYIVKLEIPEDALRSSATTRKCRCSKAKVLSITNLDGTDADTDIAYSSHDPSFIYKIGEIVEVPDFNTDRWDECSAGIHFFITRKEAVDY